MGTICAVSGVLVLSLPIPIIAQNFEKFHQTQQKKQMAETSKRTREEAKRKELEERLAHCRQHEQPQELKLVV